MLTDEDRKALIDAAIVEFAEGATEDEAIFQVARDILEDEVWDALTEDEEAYTALQADFGRALRAALRR